jgi:hypothetical protein
VQGYVIMLLFGTNVAWTYRGPDVLFNVSGLLSVPALGYANIPHVLSAPCQAAHGPSEPVLGLTSCARAVTVDVLPEPFTAGFARPHPPRTRCFPLSPHPLPRRGQGNVKLGYLVPWLGLGAAVEALYWRVLTPTSLLLAHLVPGALAAAAVATLVLSEDLGLPLLRPLRLRIGKALGRRAQP